MKQKFKIILALLFFSLNFLTVQKTFAAEKCYGTKNDICLTVTSTPAGTIPEKTNVALNFSVAKKDKTDLCESGRSIHNLLVHYEGGIQNQGKFIKQGTGSSFSYTFNSGAKDQPNKYMGIFACLTSPADISNLSELQRTNKAWTIDFSQNTGQQVVTTPPTDPGKPLDNSKPSTGNVKEVDCENDPDGQNCIYNPLPTSDLASTFMLIVKGFLVMTGAWSTLFIIVGGFRMVVSAGDEEAYTKGKQTITWAVLGLVAAMLSFSIVAVVQNLLHVGIK